MTIDRASVEQGARLAAEAPSQKWHYVHADDDSYGNEINMVKDENNAQIQYAEDCYSSEKERAISAFIAHWNPEFAAELVRDWLRLEAELADARRTLRNGLEELTRLRRVEEAARAHLEHTVRFCVDTEGVCPSHRRLKAALVNPATEAAGDHD